MKKKIIFIFSIFWSLLSLQTKAQEADDYAFTTNTNSSFVTLTNSKQLLAGGLTLTSSPVESLGFEMWFMGVRYTDFSVNANGTIQLGKTQIVPKGDAYTIANTARIVPFASGINSPIGDWKIANDGKIHYQVFGTSPNRVVVIEANKLLINSAVLNETATFQVWLYETAPLPTTTQGGKIEFRYATMQCGVDSIIATRIGIGSDATRNKFKGVDLKNTPPTARIDDTAIENVVKRGNITSLHSTNPNALRIFTFEAPAPNGQVSNLKGSIANGNQIKLDWEENATNEVGSVIYKSTNGKDYTFLTQVNGSTTFTDTDVVPCVNYFYKVYTVTEGKLGVLQSTASLTYQIAPPLSIDIKGNLLSCPSNPTSVKEIEAVDANNSFEKFFWLNSNNDTLGRGKTFTPSLVGDYQLVGQTKDGCTAIKKFTTVECCEVIVVIPTAFTPFSTPANNLFFVRAENVTKFYLQVYNRWGLKVFDANDSGIGWNGTYYDGKPLQAGAYQVIVEYTGCKEGKTVNETAMAVLYLIE